MKDRVIKTAWFTPGLFFLKALIGGSVLYLLSRIFGASPLWTILTVFLLAIPIGLGGVYGTTINQTRRLHIFGNQGWIYRLCSRRFLPVALWAVWALVSSFLMLIHFHIYTPLQWLVFALVVPFFCLAFRASHRLLASELKPYLVIHMALLWARRLTPWLMLLIYLVILVQFDRPAEHLSLAEAIESVKAKGAGLQGSALAREASQLVALVQGTKAYALGQLGMADALWALVLHGLAGLVIFYNACVMLSCLLIPRREYRRIFGALTDADAPPSLPPDRITRVAVIAAAVSLLVYLPLMFALEGWVSRGPISERRQSAEAVVIPRLEQIGEALFREGTIAELNRASIEAIQRVDAHLDAVESSLDEAFKLLEANVDDYLDWHYSLRGEYVRLGALVSRDIEGYISRKLQEYLEQGDAFGAIQETLDAALSEFDRGSREYGQLAAEIMERNRVAAAPPRFELVGHASGQDLLNLSHVIDRFRDRLKGATTTAGVMTAYVARRVLLRATGQNTLKAAARAMTRAAAGRAAGGRAGAGLAGAAVGSVVPGVGTAAGGIAGFVGAWVGTDWALLKIDEYRNRETFRTDLISAIHQAREELMGELRGEGDPSSD
jgi:hypothetical protein